MNQLGELAFVVSGAITALALITRRASLTGKQRNAVAAAVIGLFLCGRYAELVTGAANWIFVLGCGGVMGMLAFNNLGFSEDKGL